MSPVVKRTLLAAIYAFLSMNFGIMAGAALADHQILAAIYVCMGLITIGTAALTAAALHGQPVPPTASAGPTYYSKLSPGEIAMLINVELHGEEKAGYQRMRPYMSALGKSVAASLTTGEVDSDLVAAEVRFIKRQAEIVASMD